MRARISISLLVLFSLTLIFPFLSATETNPLPACCRRDGKHHCTMMMSPNATSPALGGIGEKCPYPLHGTVAAHPNELGCPAGQFFHAEVLSHPALHAQTVAQRRISFSRTRQKRGPPALFL